MNFLNNLGISNETIKNIIKYNDESIKLTIECNEKNITKIINFFKEIGIKNIDELLTYEIDIFLKDYDLLKYQIIKSDIEKIVENINQDYTAIEIFY